MGKASEQYFRDTPGDQKEDYSNPSDTSGSNIDATPHEVEKDSNNNRSDTGGSNMDATQDEVEKDNNNSELGSLAGKLQDNEVSQPNRVNRIETEMKIHPVPVLFSDRFRWTLRPDRVSEEVVKTV